MIFGVGRRVLRCSLLLILFIDAATRRDRHPRLLRRRWLNRLDYRLFDGARSKDLLVLVVWSVIGVDCHDRVSKYIEVTIGGPLGIARLERHCLSLVGLPSMLFALDLRPAQVGVMLSRLGTLNQKQTYIRNLTKSFLFVLTSTSGSSIGLGGN